MKLAHVAVASAAVLGISYAVAQTHSQFGQPCSPCQAVIVIPAGCGGGITVAPDPIRAMGKAPVSITWKIVSPGWTFANEGIVVKLAGSKFKTASKAPDTFTLQFDPSGPDAVYKYDINLVKAGAPCKVDPTIVNH